MKILVMSGQLRSRLACRSESLIDPGAVRIEQMAVISSDSPLRSSAPATGTSSARSAPDGPAIDATSSRGPTLPHPGAFVLIQLVDPGAMSGGGMAWNRRSFAAARAS